MLRNRNGRILAGMLALALVAVAAGALVLSKPEPAAAQFPGAPPSIEGGPARPAPGIPEPSPPGFPDMGRRPPEGDWPRYPTAPTGGGTAAIAAAGEYVYVVQGNTLYQFSARSLRLVNKAQLATTPSPPVYRPQETPGQIPGMQ